MIGGNCVLLQNEIFYHCRMDLNKDSLYENN